MQIHPSLRNIKQKWRRLNLLLLMSKKKKKI